MPPKILLLVSLIFPSMAAQAQHQFRILHAFGAGNDGAGVWDSVTLDLRGNVFGTTIGGGAHNGGTAFHLAPGSGGHWQETILHGFPSSPNDGNSPIGGLMLDGSGNLYGTTEGGGGPYTYGTVYELSRGHSAWRETVLHRFGKSDQAGSPWGNLAMDLRGNLFGSAFSVFEVSQGSKGWNETVLHVFDGKDGDGRGAAAGPIWDASGNLYGTTFSGGGGHICTDGCGTVWQLQPSAGDGSAPMAWTEHILHRFGFSDSDGVWPGPGQLAMDSAGNIFGTAQGGKTGAGIVFKLTRLAGESSQQWQETILYNFTGGADGDTSSGVILDMAGNLYGTTSLGGSPSCGCGVVFKLSPQADGSWKYTLLHTFVGTDGGIPDANPTLGTDGKLYGTTSVGGAYGSGVVFQLTP